MKVRTLDPVINDTTGSTIAAADSEGDVSSYDPTKIDRVLVSFNGGANTAWLPLDRLYFDWVEFLGLAFQTRVLDSIEYEHPAEDFEVSTALGPFRRSDAILLKFNNGRTVRFGMDRSKGGIVFSIS